MHWRMEGKYLFLTVEGRKFPVKTLRIMANGTQDFCLIKDPTNPAGYNFGSYLEDTPSPENLIWKPDGDVAIIEFHEKLPQSQGGRSILFLETEGMEPLLAEVMRRNPEYVKKGLYDAYLGKNYERVP